ncbi:MAG: serine/threonine protein kinase [Verrucomicrobiales bacterium]|nr:serine/threonine protein kinase [Verrucomicrobiales bacterium]
MADLTPLNPSPEPVPKPTPDSTPPADSPCPGDDLFRRLLEDALSPEALARIGVHLESCPSCRRRLDTLAGTEHVVPASRPLTDVHRVSAALTGLMDKLRAVDWVRTPADADAPPPTLELLSPPRMPGSLGRFAGYEVLERVASGGMGIVFKANDPGLSRIVAIKILAPVLAASESARARFLREARAAAAVTHEHVVAIHAVGEERGLPFLVMQFVAGKSLETRLRHGSMDLSAILRIGLQTAEGLAAAHAQGLVHRDVKPGNILLENGVERVKLTDFGLARAADEPGVTRPGVVAGTPEFMSPEQARGDRVDTRSDLFSLGGVLYLMATGRSPFAADSTPATLRRVCEEQPPRADTLRTDIPEHLADLIERLLSKRPEDRPATAAEVATALRRMLRDLDLESPPQSRRASDKPTTSPHRPPWKAAFAIVTLALGIAVWALLYRTPSSPHSASPVATQAPLATLPASVSAPAFVVSAPDNMPPRLSPSLEEAVAAAPSGATIELRYNGIHESRPIRIVGKNLHLRAAPGMRPEVVNRSTSEALIGSDSTLIVEGIELRSAQADSDSPDDVPPMITTRRLLTHRFRDMRDGTPAPAILAMRGGELHLSGCRLVTSTRRSIAGDAIVLRGTARAVIRNSELYTLGGATVWWLRRAPGDQGRVEIRDTVFYSVIPVFLGGSTDSGCQVEIRRCTVLGSQLLVVPGTLHAELRLAESVVVTRTMVPSNIDNRPALNLRVTEEYNLFSSRSPVVARGDAKGFPGPKSAAANLAFGDRLRRAQERTNRLAAWQFDLRPEELDLLRRAGISKADDEPAVQPGAPINLVGPGDPYTRWRQTESYEAWSREVTTRIQSHPAPASTP